MKSSLNQTMMNFILSFLGSVGLAIVCPVNSVTRYTRGRYEDVLKQAGNDPFHILIPLGKHNQNNW